MKRRDFIKGSAAAASLPFWLQGCDFLIQDDFPIHVRSDHGTGHLLMTSQEWPEVKSSETDYLIVGGGLAGLSTAYSLKNRDFQLYELSDRLGGTSGAIEGLHFSQGAHYELAYPDYYGEDVLKLLEELDVIEFESWKKMWSFKDREHIIPFARKQRCHEGGEYRNEVITASLVKNRFYELLKDYEGKMPLPTRLINEKYKHLNAITFLDFLEGEIAPTPEFIRQLDYHMMDDWGGRTHQVSALAGIHYFACRPYTTKAVELFSPPQGNAYFAEKIITHLPAERVKTSHLVAEIVKTGDGFEVTVLDVVNKKRLLVKSNKVIYAGQKHALKYIYPKEAGLFNLEQAPWMVMNFLTSQKKGAYGFWQNEFLGDNSAFMGFIDSSVQDQKTLGDRRVLTAYYCLESKDREYLTTVPDKAESIVAETLKYVSETLGQRPEIEACHVNVMGHAMTIPSPGFLFNDANHKGSDLIYAGVDNGRLPLLYEALDSGLILKSI